MKMHYTGPLVGRQALITFPDSVAEVTYLTDGSLSWQVTEKNGRVSNGSERICYMQLSDTLHFLNWREKSGFTVSQVIDTEQGVVRAFWSYADLLSDTGHQVSMFVDGKFEFCGTTKQ